MCGIVGYTGKKQAAPILLDGLAKLEYRGYDSAGICVYGENVLEVVKSKGQLQVLSDKTDGGNAVRGTVGIGHTRWATHGVPSDINSHPHLSDSGKISLVHNGVIENEAKLRQQLLDKGVNFHSETDTEVIANLVGYFYEQDGDFLGAIRQAMARLEGSFALGIMCQDLPGTIVAVKKDSPLIFGYGEGENFIASDVPAILKYTRTVVYMDEGEMVVFNDKDVAFYNAYGDRIGKQSETITWEMSAAERGGYEHFMLKEIMEQPDVVRKTISPRIRDGRVELESISLTKQDLQNIRKIYLVACGSAYYVSVLAKYTIEKTCRIPAEAIMASEFIYSDPVINEDNLVIIISQSGETADTKSALLEAKRRGAKTLAIVNVVGSAISKLADQVIYTWAGPEIAVATTKAFSTQLAVVYLLTLHMAQELGTMPQEELRSMVNALEALPEALEKVINEDHMKLYQYYASRYYNNHDAFYIGRNLDSAVCLEGSLKLKEVAYLHSEAYPAGELKHGPIALIEDGTLVVALATVDGLFDRTIANVREVNARGADVLCLTLEGFEEQTQKVTESFITVPKVRSMFQPSVNLIPLQAFAYYMAVNRGCNVDKPRNLAKSVTVE